MKAPKELNLSDVISLYVEHGNLDAVGRELDCTRQHIDAEIKRQCGYESGGIKKLVFEFYTKAMNREEREW